MRRVRIAPRPDWRATAEASGFDFHTIDGAPYWDESAFYQFSLREIEEDIEAPTAELHAMAMDLVDEVVASEALMDQLDIPPHYRDWIASSWQAGELQLYGRMDLAYDGHGPAKLFEFNYDTPTSIYEAAYFQWVWLEQQKQRSALPAGADQFNSLQEALVESLATMAHDLPRPFYFSAITASREDAGTIAYLRDCTLQAGIDTGVIDIGNIGVTASGAFTDLQDTVIGTLFKLYPLEQMMGDAFGQALPRSGLRLIEPPWKAILSNKGVLPLLWQRHRGHPNLLESYVEPDASVPLGAGWVRKPFFSREGANVTMRLADGEEISSPGPYGAGRFIRQAYHALPRTDGGYPLIGSWMIADRAAGMGIREDHGLITRDTSRFIPHAIID
jgi:glutathionylspermidine synthase